jgi:hypothetical protein
MLATGRVVVSIKLTKQVLPAQATTLYVLQVVPTAHIELDAEDAVLDIELMQI